MSKAGPVECVTPSRRYSFNSPNIASQTLQQTYETAAVCSLSSSPPIYPVWKYMGIPPSSPYPPPPPPPSLTPPLPPAPLSLPNSPLGYMVTSSPNVGPYGPVPPAVAPLCSSQFVSATVTSLCVPNSPGPAVACVAGAWHVEPVPAGPCQNLSALPETAVPLISRWRDPRPGAKPWMLVYLAYSNSHCR